MNLLSGKNAKGISLRERIKLYQKRAKEIEAYLSKNPQEWGKFQSEFNAEVNDVFRDVMNFERKCLAKNEEDKVYKLKRLFVEKFRHIFAKGDYVLWSLRKPFGYAGDFKIIDDFYKNKPTTTGFNRLFDNYTQMSALAVAVRNRKNDFKKSISDYIKKNKSSKFRIMDLASGPCRDLKELFSQEDFPLESVTVDCYENDQRAIDYAKKILNNLKNVNFFKMNAVKMALKKDINSIIDKKYDIIYSTGLFDYFTEEISTRLVRNLKKLLADNGLLLIASVRDKFSNPTVYFMEWAGEWNLVYRSDEEFKRIFVNAGFSPDDLKNSYEQQGIIQYMQVKKR